MHEELNQKPFPFLTKGESIKASGYHTGISLTAALAGSIFGFDTVVISGANL